MADGPRYRVKFRRRRQGKTNYYYRKRLLTSELPRLVVRKSLKHIKAQIINAEMTGDKIIIQAHTSELSKNYDWKYNTSNTPAAYLTGYLIGKKALKNKIESAILDIGIYRPIANTKLFAVLKGALDAGLDIPHGEEIFPSEDRIIGKHIVDYAAKLEEEDKSLYKKQFSKLLKNKFDPKQISSKFKEIKQKIDKNIK
ncbi:MAG: 50S ribosomal protein L18 [Candidatus Lokiarchaeota archaeon]|nr:50S ribosomal protein L18 [Candidatus Lokiarchaeota archaeon]